MRAISADGTRALADGVAQLALWKEWSLDGPVGALTCVAGARAAAPAAAAAAAADDDDDGCGGAWLAAAVQRPAARAAEIQCLRLPACVDARTVARRDRAHRLRDARDLRILAGEFASPTRDFGLVDDVCALAGAPAALAGQPQPAMVLVLQQRRTTLMRLARVADDGDDGAAADAFDDLVTVAHVAASDTPSGTRAPGRQRRRVGIALRDTSSSSSGGGGGAFGARACLMSSPDADALVLVELADDRVAVSPAAAVAADAGAGDAIVGAIASASASGGRGAHVLLRREHGGASVVAVYDCARTGCRAVARCVLDGGGAHDLVSMDEHRLLAWSAHSGARWLDSRKLAASTRIACRDPLPPATRVTHVGQSTTSPAEHLLALWGPDQPGDAAHTTTLARVAAGPDGALVLDKLFARCAASPVTHCIAHDGVVMTADAEGTLAAWVPHVALAFSPAAQAHLASAAAQRARRVDDATSSLSKRAHTTAAHPACIRAGDEDDGDSDADHECDVE